MLAQPYATNCQDGLKKEGVSMAHRNYRSTGEDPLMDFTRGKSIEDNTPYKDKGPLGGQAPPAKESTGKEGG
jgi:hypothetical protein